MALRLLEHLESPLKSKHLLDSSLQAPPETLNPWALFCGWAFDWLLAIAASKLAVGAWMEFMGPLGFDSLAAPALALITAYAKGVSLLVAPLLFFAMHFVGVHCHGTTPGLRLFKHRVESPHAKNSMMWAWASTVSAAMMGLPLLTSWLDRLALTQTQSNSHQRWMLSQKDLVVEVAPDLVQQSMNNHVIDDKRAA